MSRYSLHKKQGTHRAFINHFYEKLRCKIEQPRSMHVIYNKERLLKSLKTSTMETILNHRRSKFTRKGYTKISHMIMRNATRV